MKTYRSISRVAVLTASTGVMVCSLVSGQVHDLESGPTVEDIVSAESDAEEAVLARAALEKWEPGDIVTSLREFPRFRRVFMDRIAADNVYAEERCSMPARLISPIYDRSLLYKKLVATFLPELGKDESLFIFLLADEDASVRYHTLQLLIWSYKESDKIEVRVDADHYHVWMSTVLGSVLEDADKRIVADALRQALDMKASVAMSAVEGAWQRLDEAHWIDCVRLAGLSYEQEKAVDFVLQVLESKPRQYDLILKELGGILSGGGVASPVTYGKLEKALSEEGVPFYAKTELMTLLKKCDRYRAMEYMLGVVLADKSGEQLRLSDSPPSLAESVLVETAVAEDIPQLIEAHKKRTNTWQFKSIGYALIRAKDDRYIRAILEDYVLSDTKRVLSDMERGTGYACDAAGILRYALNHTKPAWAYDLLAEGVEDIECHVWHSLMSIMVENNLSYGLPVLERRLEKEPDVNNARKIRRAIERLRIRSDDKGRYDALAKHDPYVVKMGLEAFVEQPDASVLERIITLAGHDDPVIATSAVAALSRQPRAFFAGEGIEPEFLRAVVVVYAGDKSMAECAELIRGNPIQADSLPERPIRECRAMLLSENPREVLSAVRILMKADIRSDARAMILAFASEEELHRVLLARTHRPESALGEAVRLSGPPEYGNIILPCVTCGEFNLSGRISKMLFPVLVQGVVLPNDWYKDTDEVLTRLIELRPALIDKLVSLSRAEDEEVAVSAARYLMLVWPLVEGRQQDDYLSGCMELSCSAKKSHEAGGGGWIHFNYTVRHGWDGFPKNVTLKTIGRHYLDGVLYGEPFVYEGPMARTGNIDVRKVEPGRHTCSMEMCYEFVTEGRTVSGVITMPEAGFIVEE